MKKSILFISPDYHCSFFYRDALRKRGWVADIYVPSDYPKKLLYSNKDIIKLKKSIYILKPIFNFIYLFIFFMKYKYFFCYGGNTRLLPLLPSFIEKRLGDSFHLDLLLAKIFRKRLIYLPSGCLDVDLKENIQKFDNGNICGNCGYGTGVCDDTNNIRKFNYLRKFFDIIIGNSNIISTQYNSKIIKYKSIDLDLWKPNLDIPKQFLLPKTENIRILHGFFKENRENDSKNIKGSPFIINAINRLKKEGYNVEYFYISNIESKNMRFYQAQANIIVEQLIYGWWGSTGVETMSLGKPVICYLREDAKINFYKYFPEYNSLPIIEANTNNIYTVLKKTVEDDNYRKEKGLESRKFAESFFDINKNVNTFEQMLLEMN